MTCLWFVYRLLSQCKLNFYVIVTITIKCCFKMIIIKTPEFETYFQQDFAFESDSLYTKIFVSMSALSSALLLSLTVIYRMEGQHPVSLPGRKNTRKGTKSTAISHIAITHRASLVTQMSNAWCLQCETRVRSLGWERSMENSNPLNVLPGESHAWRGLSGLVHGVVKSEFWLSY